MPVVDWETFDLEPLAAELRAKLPAPDAEKMVWAFEEALHVARVDDGLLEHLIAAAVCLRASSEDETPRTILEQLFRRSVSDGEWRDEYAHLVR